MANALAFTRVALIEREAAFDEPKAIGAASGMLHEGRVVAVSDLTAVKDERPAALVVFYRAQLVAARYTAGRCADAGARSAGPRADGRGRDEPQGSRGG